MPVQPSYPQHRRLHPRTVSALPDRVVSFPASDGEQVSVDTSVGDAAIELTPLSELALVGEGRIVLIKRSAQGSVHVTCEGVSARLNGSGSKQPLTAIGAYSFTNTETGWRPVSGGHWDGGWPE